MGCPLVLCWMGALVVRMREREKEERRCKFVCNICGGPYLDSTRDDITECPNCGALNERLGLSDL